jgi:hypothetical protein
MHLLGHALGLKHGGAPDTPDCKPNYLSVMNSDFLFPDPVPNRRLDSSRSIVLSLNENLLNEPAAIGPISPPAQPTAVDHTNTPAGLWSVLPATTNNSSINYNGYTGNTDSTYTGVMSAMHD